MSDFKIECVRIFSYVCFRAPLCFRNSQEDRNNRRKDKELISESSPPPSKRSRDSSESKDETNKK